MSPEDLNHVGYVFCQDKDHKCHYKIGFHVFLESNPKPSIKKLHESSMRYLCGVLTDEGNPDSRHSMVNHSIDQYSE